MLRRLVGSAALVAATLTGCFASSAQVEFDETEAIAVPVPEAMPAIPEPPPMFGEDRGLETAVPVLGAGRTEPLVVRTDGDLVCVDWLDAGGCGSNTVPASETFLLGAGGHGDASRTCGAWWASADVVEVAVTDPDGRRWVQPPVAGAEAIVGRRVFALCWAYGQPIEDAGIEGLDANGEVIAHA